MQLFMLTDLEFSAFSFTNELFIMFSFVYFCLLSLLKHLHLVIKMWCGVE